MQRLVYHHAKEPPLPPAREARGPKKLLWAGWPDGPAPQTRPGRRQCGLPSSPDHSLARLALLTSGNTGPGERSRGGQAGSSRWWRFSLRAQPQALGSSGGRPWGRPSARLQGSLPLLPLGALRSRFPARDAAGGKRPRPAQWASSGQEPGSECPQSVSPPSLSGGSATPCCSACSEGLRLGAPGARQCVPAGHGAALAAGGCSSPTPTAARPCQGRRLSSRAPGPSLFLPIPEQ